MHGNNGSFALHKNAATLSSFYNLTQYDFEKFKLYWWLSLLANSWRLL